MGGAVAWTFAATRPERVSHLILVDAAGYPREGEAPLRDAARAPPLVGDIGIYFKPERLVRRALPEIYADPAMVTPERVQPLRRAAALSRQPRRPPCSAPAPRSRSIRRRSSGSTCRP